jgi:hypothetical protein
MLPGEKAERWVRQIGYLALVLIGLYIVVWVSGFIWRVTRQVLVQRAVPDETQVETRGPAGGGGSRGATD